MEGSTLINATFIDAVTVMEFFRQLREDYVDKPVKIVLDNARRRIPVHKNMPREE
jgi:hypothetical protein